MTQTTIVNEQITVECSIGFSQIISLGLDSKVNEHAIFKLNGIATDDHSVDMIAGGPVWLYSQNDGKKSTIFTGFVEFYTINNIGQAKSIELYGISVSRYMDKEKKNNFFQLNNQWNSELFHTVMDNQGDIFVESAFKKRVTQPYLQLEETDWEFMKRISSRLQAFVIPNIFNNKLQIKIGGSLKNSSQLNCFISYKEIFERIVLDNKAILAKSYLVKSYADYQLGISVSFADEVFLIVEKKAEYINGDFFMQYKLMKYIQPLLAKKYNEKIVGLGLPGVILGTSAESVKIKLGIECPCNNKKAFNFKYLPTTGNLLYSMPETGANAMLYFPDEDEANAYVRETFTVNNLLPEKSKGFLSEENKNIILSEDGLCVLSEISMMDMSDENGLNIVSSKNIEVITQKQLEIYSKGICEIDAGDSIDIEHSQRAALKIKGSELSLSGSTMVTSSLPDYYKPMVVSKAELFKQMKPISTQVACKIQGSVPNMQQSEIEEKIFGAIATFADPQKPAGAGNAGLYIKK